MDLLACQLAECAARGVACVPCPPEGMVGVARATLDGRLPLNGMRHPAERGTTSWYLWAGEEMPAADDAFAPVHAEHLHAIAAPALPFLGLPPGSRFLVAGDYVDVWFDAALLDV